MDLCIKRFAPERTDLVALVNMEICAPRTYLDKQVLFSSKNARKPRSGNMDIPCNMAGWSFKMGSCKLIHFHEPSVMKHFDPSHRRSSLPVNMEKTSVQLEDHSNDEEDVPSESPKDFLARPPSSDQLKALLSDSERERLIKKLSHANQQNRLLKRQLQAREDDLVNFKSELAALELEIQGLVKLAEEIAQSGIPEGSRKINGKYIQSHLLTRLEGIQKEIKQQIKDVNLAQSKEVSIIWYGMAESVQVMGSFDGWSTGQDLSPEYTGAYSKFSTTLTLRPGRYEMKLLVDGEWQLSPQFPTVGEGLMENNLLIVE